MKYLIKSLIPPILLNILKNNNKYGWRGNYSNWEEARNDAIGYDSDEILQAVKKSLLKVKNGEAIYERDSVIFDKIQYSWQLLAGLMFCSAKMGGTLKVLDFGGSLGSSYYQNKKFLDTLENVSWNIVEQKNFVDIGRLEFQDDKLKFYYSISDCIKSQNPNVLLLSSVLQYIENPYKLLDEILEYDFDFILLDRMIFSKENKGDMITVQNVNLKGYSSIPSWLFSEDKLLSYFYNKYHLLEDYDIPNEENNQKYEKGLIWIKK
ncbi:methyltransferase, TIGR04325 family [Candidatus Thioglobus sp.]|nr:methyltransferase, TIGR04325 family [Candidatus Thioglobus sp.]